MKSTQKDLLGVIPKERIKTLEIKRPPRRVIDEFLKIEDMSGATARALDELGIVGGIGPVTLRPLVEGKKVVGPAITVRDVPSRISRYYGIINDEPSYQKGECEAYYLAEPGDVIVIRGQTTASSMGGESATLAKSRGMAGSIIDGLCTGIPRIKKADYPVWSRGGTTITGHHRLETVEINGTISCAGVQVQPGDLIVADDTGVAVVPNNLTLEVLNILQKKAPTSRRVQELVKGGAKPSEIGKVISKHGRR